MLSPGSHLRRRLVTYLLLAAFVLLLAGGGFAAFESRQVSNCWEGLWWALSLMSTVGFVGEAPESLVGRLLSSVLMISGFALMALVTASTMLRALRMGRRNTRSLTDVLGNIAVAAVYEIARALALVVRASHGTRRRGEVSTP